MDKPTRFFINTEQLPGEVAGKLVAMGKQLLARFDLMREAGMVGDVWTQRTNDGIVFKLDKSGDVDNVKIFMPMEILNPTEEEKEKEKEIEELVFYLWVNDDAEGNKRIRLWDSNLESIGEVLSNTLEKFYPEVEEKYITAEDCYVYNDYYGFGYGCGQSFFSQLEYRKEDFNIKELVSIQDLTFNDWNTGIYTEGWTFGINGVYLRHEDSTETLTPESIVHPGHHYVNTYDDYTYWSFDDEESGYALLYPSDGTYTWDQVKADLTVDTQLVVTRYNTNLPEEDYEIKETLKSGENIWTYIYSARTVGVRNNVATGWYSFGFKDAYPETLNTWSTHVRDGITISASGITCMEYKNYSETSCYIYMVNKEFANYSHVNELTYTGWATDSSGDNIDYISTPLPDVPTFSREYSVVVNDPYNGERSYVVETLPEDGYVNNLDIIIMFFKIYDYGGFPLYTYAVYNLYRDIIYYGYIYKDKHIKSKEFEITGNSSTYDYLHSFGDPVNGEVIETFYPDWNTLHAAIKTTYYKEK